jgi:hypothetical protein
MKTTDLRRLIAAAESKIAAIRSDIDGEIAKLRAAASNESARLEAYANALRSAALLESGGSTGRPGGRKRKASRGRKKTGTATMSGRRGRKPGASARKSSGGRGTTTKFRKGSLPDRVRAMVLSSKKPIHLSDVVKQVGPKKATLQSVENRISALARKRAAFVRTAPRTYGLLELGHKASAK